MIIGFADFEKVIKNNFFIHSVPPSPNTSIYFVFASGAGMMGDIFFDKMTAQHKEMLSRKMCKLADRVSDLKPVKYKSLKVNVIFAMCKLQHKMVLRSETQPSLDNAHYIKNGWIKE